MPSRHLLPLSSFFLILASCHSNPNSAQLKEIDNGLRLSIYSIVGQNAAVYVSLQQKLADPATRSFSNRWSPFALKVQMLSAGAISYIDSLHAKMSTSGWLSKEDEKSLFDTLVNCRHDLLNVFPDSLDPSGGYIAEDRIKLRRHIPLLLDTYGHAQPDLTFSEWADHLFQRDTSLITLSLDKLKIDVLLSEQEIVKYCDKHIISTVDRFDIFAPLVTLNSNVVSPGDTIELRAGIGEYLSSARTTVTIAGISVLSISGGFTFYKLRASEMPGRYFIPVTIEYTKPYGGRSTVTQDIRYRVINRRAQ